MSDESKRYCGSCGQELGADQECAKLRAEGDALADEAAKWKKYAEGAHYKAQGASNLNKELFAENEKLRAVAEAARELLDSGDCIHVVDEGITEKLRRDRFEYALAETRAALTRLERK